MRTRNERMVGQQLRRACNPVPALRVNPDRAGRIL